MKSISRNQTTPMNEKENMFYNLTKALEYLNFKLLKDDFSGEWDGASYRTCDIMGKPFGFNVINLDQPFHTCIMKAISNTMQYSRIDSRMHTINRLKDLIAEISK